VFGEARSTAFVSVLQTTTDDSGVTAQHGWASTMFALDTRAAGTHRTPGDWMQLLSRFVNGGCGCTD
jgi:hypothetical protein